MSHPNRHILIGDFVEILSSNRDLINSFQIIDIQYNDIIIINLNSNNPNDNIFLEISSNGNAIFNLDDTYDTYDNILLVNFIGSNDIELFDGLQCNTPESLKTAIERLTDFWYGDETILNLSRLGCEQLMTNYFTQPRIVDKLLSLSLNDNKLVSIPKEIGNLEKLQTLYLSNNKLTSIPEEIGNLTNLKTLSLLLNNLTSLPISIGNLHYLEELHLSYNHLTSVPEEIGNLHNLKSLLLSHNKLTYLPISIGNLPNLRQFNLLDNPLEEGTPTQIEELRERYESYMKSTRRVKSAMKR